jgi:hypothetical protein
LESNIQIIILPQLQELNDQSIAEDVYDYHIILDQFFYIYSNFNKIEEVENKFYKLQQNINSFTIYINRFEYLLYETKSFNWPEANKVFFFRNSLHQIFRNKLTGQLNLPKDYTNFLKIIQQLAGHSTSISFNPSSAFVSTNGKSTFKPQLPEPMNISAFQPIIIVKYPLSSFITNQKQIYKLEIINIWDGLKKS